MAFGVWSDEPRANTGNSSLSRRSMARATTQSLVTTSVNMANLSIRTFIENDTIQGTGTMRIQASSPDTLYIGGPTTVYFLPNTRINWSIDAHCTGQFSEKSKHRV